MSSGKAKVKAKKAVAKFQSPLHRGMSSGTKFPTMVAQAAEVSIPSSSGHVIGPCIGATEPFIEALFQSPLHRGMSSGDLVGKYGEGESDRFNPLFIGACHRATARSLIIRRNPTFQSPLHRGMSSGFSGRTLTLGQASRFNPLFIGACHRARMDEHRRTASRRFNPLFIGACHRASAELRRRLEKIIGFNPLFIGACHRAYPT